MWLVGLVLGFILGFGLSESFGGALLLAIIGTFIGAAFSRSRGASKESPYFNAQGSSGEERSGDVQELRREIRLLQRRVSDIERHLGGEPAKAPLEEKSMPAAARAIPPVEKTVKAPPPEKKPEAPRPVVPPASKVPDATPVPPSKSAPPKPAEPPRPPVTPKPPRPRPPRPPAEPSPVNEFIQRWVIGGNPLVKVGVLILFLGLGFALRLAADYGLFPVWMRYLAVAAAGVTLLVLGWRFRGREDNYGLVMQGGGIGVLYLTTLAAMKLHPLLPMGAGFAILVLVAALGAFLAVVEDSVVLAVVAALGGFAAPVLASTGSGNHIALFSYLTVLNLGIVGIAWFRSWRVLNILGYVCSFGLGSSWAVQHYRDELFWTTEPFLLLLFGLYVLITVLFARRTLADAPDASAQSLGAQVRQASKQVKYVDGSLAFGVPFSAFWVQSLLVEPYDYGTAISAAGFSAFYFLLAFVLFKRTGARYSLLNETLVALGAVFGTLAIPLLETAWTSAAWAIEAAGVYWIGWRQRQVHVRLFALLVLLGSAIFFLPELSMAQSGSVLDGPLLSALLLTASAGFTYWLTWRAEPGQLLPIEASLRPMIVGFGGLMLATIPMLLLVLEWASPALAVVGTALIFLSTRMSDRPLLYTGWVFQFVGGALFLATLDGGGAGAVLATGWAGLLATCLVGTAMLVGVWAVAPDLLAGGENKATEKSPELETPISAVLLAGLAFINLAPLFVLSWRLSAMVWPIIGIGTLIWAVRTRHVGVILFSIGLQVIAGLSHLRTRSIFDAAPAVSQDISAFFNSGFLGPLIISLAALACARLMHRGRDRNEFDIALGWLAIGWAGLWWAFGWAAEVTRVLPASSEVAALIAITLATASAWSVLSRRLDWTQLGQAVLAYMPVLIVLAVADVAGVSPHPLAGWGVLAWPAALIVHGLLLRRQAADLAQRLTTYAHIAGTWLFVVLASVEIRWWLVQWSDSASAWSLLSGMLVPALYVWAMTRPRIQALWPIRAHFNPYAMTAAFPLVVYLLGWLWITNMFSDGSAQPLPYLPVLNPLEIGYLGVLAIGYLWWQMVRDRIGLDNLSPIATGVLAASTFAALTGGVIRACHHWANIPWQVERLVESYTVQTSLSVAWGSVAISLMLVGNRRQHRSIWVVGAALVAIVVAKLFLVELAASGTLQRIVSFIGVGLMLLFVGYVAPLPPRKHDGKSTSL